MYVCMYVCMCVCIWHARAARGTGRRTAGGERGKRQARDREMLNGSTLIESKPDTSANTHQVGKHIPKPYILNPKPLYSKP